MKHKHHIIPRHAGGTDDLINIILLTVEQHATAHKKLFEKYNRWQDKIAWLGLSGRIGKEEIIQLKNSEKAKKQWENEEYRKKMSKLASDSHLGIPKSKQQREKMSKAQKGKPKSKEHIQKLCLAQKGKHKGKDNGMYNKKHSELTIQKMKESRKNVVITSEWKSNIKKAVTGKGNPMYGKKQKILTCPYCKKEGGNGAFIRWHFDNCKEK